MEHAMQFLTLIPHAFFALRFFLLLCRIPGRPLDWLMG
jgi:hypothetical protein